MNTTTIAYFRNGLGNFVLFTPALQALAAQDESGKVDVCIDGEWNDKRRPSMVELITACPFVQDLIDYPTNVGAKQYKRFFWTRHTYASDAMEYFRARAPQFDVGGSDWSQRGIHEIEYYMELIRSRFNFPGLTPEQFCGRKSYDAFIPSDARPTVALCNGSYGHLAGSKQWPHFAQLAETLQRYVGAEVVKIGYGDELAEVTHFEHDFVDKLSITETADVIARCDLLVTCDTCNMHIGDALKIPMVVIWGGSVFTKNCPVNGTASVVRRAYRCQPCHDSGAYQECADYKCLREVDVGEVVHAVRGKLGL